jgi:uncharacterized membrane protein
MNSLFSYSDLMTYLPGVLVTNLITQEKAFFVNDLSLVENIVNQILYNQNSTCLLCNEDYREVIKDRFKIIESVSVKTGEKFAYCSALDLHAKFIN